MAKVLNWRRDNIPSDAVNIDRGSDYGNWFIIGRDGTREEVIAKHKDWVLRHSRLVKKIKRELKGKDLVCWCAPLACHGDTLLEIANEEEDKS